MSYKVLVPKWTEFLPKWTIIMRERLFCYTIIYRNLFFYTILRV